MSAASRYLPILLFTLACVVCSTDARAVNPYLVGGAGGFGGGPGGWGPSIVFTTSDTSNHVWTYVTTAGHSYHFGLDWSCTWSSGANADGGRSDVTCTDSSGTVTCATGATTPSEHIGTEGCNNPSITAGTGDSVNVTISASSTSAINWSIGTTLNAN